MPREIYAVIVGPLNEISFYLFVCLLFVCSNISVLQIVQGAVVMLERFIFGVAAVRRFDVTVRGGGGPLLTGEGMGVTMLKVVVAAVDGSPGGEGELCDVIGFKSQVDLTFLFVFLKMAKKKVCEGCG